MATQTVYIEGKARYAKVFENNRDMGKNLPDGDQKAKIEETQGQYIIDVYVTPEAKAKAIADGVPDKGMVGMLWKTDNGGNDFYKAKRKHFNSNMTDKNTGEKGVVQGPPKVLKTITNDEGKDINVLWDEEEDGLIGNDSTVVVKLSVWEGKIVDLQAVLVKEHVEYIPEEHEGEYF